MATRHESRKFLSKGSYGCVFNPPIPCANQETLHRGTVGKIFEHQQDFEEEVRAYQLVKMLDPNHKWSLPIVKGCEIDTTALELDEEVARCPFMTMDTKHLYFQLVIPYGGITLWNLFTNYRVPVEWAILYLEQVLSALSTMVTKGYVHLDIKPMNVLVHEGRVLLIDFSLLQETSQVYKESNMYLMKAKYIWYPPEFYIYASLHKDSNADVESRSRKSLYVYDIPKYGLKHDASELKKQQRAIGRYMRFVVHNEKLDDLQFNTEMAKKIDIYSTGVTFLNLFEMKGYKHTEFHALLKRMVCADPRKRTSIQKALSEVRKLSKKLHNVPSLQFKKVDL